MLHLTIHNVKDIDKVRILLESPKMTHEAVEAQDNNGNTALHIAANANKTEIVRLLLASSKMSREAVEAKNNKGNTAFDLAQNDEIKQLIKDRLRSPYDILMEGIGNRDIKKVEMAIRDGVNINGPTVLPQFVESSPLMILASSSRDNQEEDDKVIQIAKLLLKNGANINHMNRFSQTVFHYVEPDSKLDKLLKKQIQFEEKFDEELTKLCKPELNTYTIDNAVAAMRRREFKKDQLDCNTLKEMFEKAKNVKMAEAAKPWLEQFLKSLAKTFTPSQESKIGSWTAFVKDTETKQSHTRQ